MNIPYVTVAIVACLALGGLGVLYEGSQGRISWGGLVLVVVGGALWSVKKQLEAVRKEK